MELKDIAKVMLDYQKYKMQSEIIRYISLDTFQQALPDLFRFSPEDFFLPVDKRLKKENEKGDKIEALASLLAGEPVSNDILLKTLGVTMEQVQQYLNEKNPIIKPIPDKLVVLTFDDACKDQYTIAAPLLKKLGFNATLFISEIEFENISFADKTRFMTWEQIKELDGMGFEIGNHSFTHKCDANQAFDEVKYFEEIDMLNDRCEKYGIPKPVSWGYPGGMCTVEQVDAVHKRGFLWGRGNVLGGIGRNNGRTIYDPLVDSPLAAPSFGDSADWSIERFARRGSNARDGRIVILAYHSQSEPEWSPNQPPFEEYMYYLYNNGYTAISMRQLGEYIDPVKAYERYSL